MKNDKIPGGVGDKTLPQDVDPKELEMGIKVEMEHTSDPELAKEIAIDHLTEDPTYYTKLATIHKEIKRVVKQTLNEIKFDKTKVISLIKKDKFLRHIVKTKKIPAEKIYSDYILPDESLRSKYLLESRVIKEAISPEDYQELKDFIRMEIASLFFDLYRKKATWI